MYSVSPSEMTTPCNHDSSVLIFSKHGPVHLIYYRDVMYAAHATQRVQSMQTLSSDIDWLRAWLPAF